MLAIFDLGVSWTSGLGLDEVPFAFDLTGDVASGSSSWLWADCETDLTRPPPREGEPGTGEETVRCVSCRAAIAARRFSASKAPIPDDFFADPIAGLVGAIAMGAISSGRTLSSCFLCVASNSPRIKSPCFGHIA
jgi:hypothetical protein